MTDNLAIDGSRASSKAAGMVALGALLLQLSPAAVRAHLGQEMSTKAASTLETGADHDAVTAAELTIELDRTQGAPLIQRSRPSFDMGYMSPEASITPFGGLPLAPAGAGDLATRLIMERMAAQALALAARQTPLAPISDRHTEGQHGPLPPYQARRVAAGGDRRPPRDRLSGRSQRLDRLGRQGADDAKDRPPSPDALAASRSALEAARRAVAGSLARGQASPAPRQAHHQALLRQLRQIESRIAALDQAVPAPEGRRA